MKKAKLDHTSCFHGGAFFDAIGVDFNNLSEKDNIINADVLDAWFDPAPKIQKEIKAEKETQTITRFSQFQAIRG